MPWARASALDRHLECPAASWYDRVDRGLWKPGYLVTKLSVLGREAPPDGSVLAEWGTQMHLAKEDPPRSSDPWRTWMEPHRERLWPSSLGIHERAWAYDCRTGLVEIHEHGDKDRWKESRGPTTVTGSTDWWAALPAGEPWVDDLKTGWPVPAVVTPQMLMYGLVAARVAGSHTVRLSITHWRRGEESPNRRWQQIGPATLERFAELLNEAWQRAAAGPNPRAGSHCRYCPSATICPLQTGEKDLE